MLNKYKEFPAETTESTKFMVLKNKDEFLNLFVTLHRKLSNNYTAAYYPVLKQVDIILRCHWDLAQTQARNFYKFLKLRWWWKTMYFNVKELLRQCQIWAKIP